MILYANKGVKELPRKASGTFDQNKYVGQFIHDNIKYRQMNFNMGKPEEAAMHAWIGEQPEGSSNYLKRLVREDMAKRQQ